MLILLRDPEENQGALRAGGGGWDPQKEAPRSQIRVQMGRGDAAPRVRFGWLDELRRETPGTQPRSRASLTTGQLLTWLFLPLPQHSVWFQLQGDINISRLLTQRTYFDLEPRKIIPLSELQKVGQMLEVNSLYRTNHRIVKRHIYMYILILRLLTV